MRYLVAIDESEQAKVALFNLLKLVQADRDEVVLLHIGDPPISQLEPLMLDDELGRLGAYVTELAETCRQMVPGISMSGTVVRGDPAADICQEASVRGVGCIVIGARGLSPVKSAIFGSVSSSVIDGSDCPVLVMRSAFPAHPQRTYLYCHDYEGKTSRKAFATMLTMARPNDFVMVVGVQAALPSGSMFSSQEHDAQVKADYQRKAAAIQRELDECVAQCVAQQLQANAIYRSGEPKTEIHDLSKSSAIDVIVLGSRHLKPLQRLMQTSVSNSLYHHGHGHAVLIVKDHIAPSQAVIG